jgi:uncharacterized Zn finger protein
MNIKCPHCNNNFIPDKKQAQFLIDAKVNAMSFIMLNCPNCKKSFPFNPTKLSDVLPGQTEKPLRCPILGCTGLVSHIKEDSFYGCGECGSIWRDKKNLFRDIANSIKSYSYRSKVYLKEMNRYLPVEPDKEPKDYDDKVRKEKAEKLTSFERD